MGRSTVTPVRPADGDLPRVSVSPRFTVGDSQWGPVTPGSCFLFFLFFLLPRTHPLWSVPTYISYWVVPAV